MGSPLSQQGKKNRQVQGFNQVANINVKKDIDTKLEPEADVVVNVEPATEPDVVVEPSTSTETNVSTNDSTEVDTEGAVASKSISDILIGITRKSKPVPKKQISVYIDDDIATKFEQFGKKYGKGAKSELINNFLIETLKDF